MFKYLFLLINIIVYHVLGDFLNTKQNFPNYMNCFIF